MRISTAENRKRCYVAPKLDLGDEPTPARDYFRENLKRRMEKLKLSESELGRRVGVAPSTVHRWITGQRYPSLEILETLAPEVGVSVAELLEEFGERPSEITLDEALRAIEKAPMTDEQALRVIEAAVKKRKRH